MSGTPSFPSLYNFAQGMSYSGPTEVAVAAGAPVQLCLVNLSRAGLLIVWPAAVQPVLYPMSAPAGGEGLALPIGQTFLWLWYETHGILPCAKWYAALGSGATTLALWQVIAAQ